MVQYYNIGYIVLNLKEIESDLIDTLVWYNIVNKSKKNWATFFWPSYS